MPVLAAPYCVTRVVDVPQAVALAALDSQVGATADEPQLELAGIGWRFCLGAPRHGGAGGDGAPGILPGVLRAGLWRQRVEVEVSPWSGEQVRVALRCRSLRYRRPLRALVVAADEALRGLDTLMRAFSDEPLTRLVADCAAGRSAITPADAPADVSPDTASARPGAGR